MSESQKQTASPWAGVCANCGGMGCDDCEWLGNGLYRVRADWEKPGKPKLQVVWDQGPLAGHALAICDTEYQAALLVDRWNQCLALLLANSPTDNPAKAGRPGSASLMASMDEVAKLLRISAGAIRKMAETMRYDEPQGVRHALDVHALRLYDLADELERPGQTKYSPNASPSATPGEGGQHES